MGINYYEVLDLPCDGKGADDIKLIGSALRQWEAQQTDALNNEIRSDRRAALQAELDYLPDMKRLLTDAGLRKAHSEAMKAERIGKLDVLIGIMSDSAAPEKTVSKARLETIAGSLGLMTVTVVKCFKEAGFAVETAAPVNMGDFILADRVMNAIESDMEHVRQYMAAHPADPMHELANAVSLYEYIAVMDGKGIGTAQDYRNMPTMQLSALFAAKMREHVRTTVPVAWYKNIESQAKVMIFRDDSSRVKYENALRLRQLKPMFELLKGLPAYVKLESGFAEACISRIKAVFYDDEQAVAVYNKYCGLPMDAIYKRGDR